MTHASENFKEQLPSEHFTQLQMFFYCKWCGSPICYVIGHWLHELADDSVSCWKIRGKDKVTVEPVFAEPAF
jgi:hypothetical protein